MVLVSRTPLSLSYAPSEVKPSSDDLAALLPPDWPLEVPLARVRTCGTLVVEVLIDLIRGSHGRLEPVYGPPSADLQAIPGMSTAFLLLALLASQPHYFVSKDTLMQTLPYLRRKQAANKEGDLGEDYVLRRPDNVISLLRKLLYPPKLLGIPGAAELRKRLVQHVRATPESGPGYRLATSPLLWLDVEAMETSLTHAHYLEEHGEDGLEAWQAVYQMGMRGQFLAHEPYSDWAKWRRLRVADLLWQSVNAQWQRALHSGNETEALEVARHLLFDFWQIHLTNEDAFCALIELLEKQGRFHQAEECCIQLCEALDREGRLPQKRTKEMMDSLRTRRMDQASRKLLSMPSEFVSDEAVVEGTLDHAGEDTGQQIVHETRHLIGRETWLAGVQQMIQRFPAKKLIILQGCVGVGKSSELMRLVCAFQRTEAGYRVIWLPLKAAQSTGGPEAALDALLGKLLSVCGIGPFPSEAPRSKLIAAWLSHLDKQNRPTVILLDNAECCLEEYGALAACWAAFLDQFLRSRHQASFVLATKEWPGILPEWQDSTFIAETFVPPLTPSESVSLLQRLGLEEILVELLQAVGRRMAGIPLLLKWTTLLATDPLLMDDWEEVDESEPIIEIYTTKADITRRLKRLLNDPSLLGKPMEERFTPLLQRILKKRFSDEARLVLNRLAVATIPLGKAAMQILCPHRPLLKELQSLSLLAAYTNRIQLLPVVATAIQQQLTPEQRRLAEEVVIEAYTRWLDEGNLDDDEAGQVVTELAVLLLTHHRLLEVAQLVVRCGWISLQLGHGPRLALLAQEIMEKIDWHQTPEYECAGLVLLNMLLPFRGLSVETKGLVNYEGIRDAFLMGKLFLHETIEGYVVHQLIFNLMNALHFAEAEALLDAYRLRLEACHVNPETSDSWFQKRALLLGTWCEYLQETGETERSHAMREETIRLYQQRAQLLSPEQSHSPLKKKLRARALGSCFSFLGDHLNRIGQHKEALQIIDQAIALQKQGLGNVGVLASSYSDKAQILMTLGRFQEALLADEEAMAEIQRCIDAGDAVSQEDIGFYYVNRGRLYLRVGRVEEAEHLFRTLPPIPEDRRIYRMFAQDGLNEVEQWRQQSVTPQHQLDWRWIKRYRELCDYDSYWWLTWAGPFTEVEQAQWDELSARPLDEATQAQLGMLMKGSRERELSAALVEHRQPSLHYPAIDIAEVQRRIAANVQLKEEIHHQEPNVIVRRLYEGEIQEELDYLHLIEATYEHNSQKFHEYSLRIFPLPTPEEMKYALAHIERTLAQGLKCADTANLSQKILTFLQEDLGLILDLTSDEDVCLQEPQKSASIQPQETPKVSAQAAKRFFEAVFRESGYEGWQVQIDLNATNERVEQGMRCLFLSDETLSLSSVKEIFIHEVAGHVARCVAGEQSSLGLLGIQTQNHASTEEGLILYHQRQLATLRGEPWNDSGMRHGTFAIGLAQGIMTPPQTFLAICSFMESFSMLRRLLTHPEIEYEVHEKRARAFALEHCLRVFRGVPSLSQAGICYPQDAIYLHGLFMIERAVEIDKTVLDRLAVGKVALELLPDLQELGITTTSLPSLYTRAYDPDLDAFILSFEESSGDAPLKDSARGGE